MEKSIDAFRTISEVADDLALPQHVLRFWETRFPQVKPLKRAGGRRYYRPADVVLLKTIRQLLYEEGFTIKGVQKLIKEQGTRAVREGSVPMPIDLAQVDFPPIDFPPIASAQADLSHAPFAPDALEGSRPDELAIAERRIEQAAEPVVLPDSIRAALEGAAAIDPTRLSRRDLGALRDALATIDECVRILGALQRPRA